MPSKYINASIDPPKRVQIRKADGSAGYWKPGQFGYAVAYSTRPGLHTLDEGLTQGGELAYLVSKSKDMAGGALWFTANGIRFTGRGDEPRPGSHARRRRDVAVPLYVVDTIHDGTDIGVRRATPTEAAEEHRSGEGWAMPYDQAVALAKESARESGGRWFDFSEDPAPRHARKKSAHARKKVDPYEARLRLSAAGIDFMRDFHELSSNEVQTVLAMAKEAGYRKRKDAPGSTARMYFQYLTRLR